MDLHPSPRLVENPCHAEAIAAVLAHLLHHAEFASRETDPLINALVQIAARYGEIITGCINKAPDLHLQTFAELLGVRARHAAAARAHVSFKPAAGATSSPVIVRMHTPLAIQGGAGEPAVFETLAELRLVRAEPTIALFANAGHRQCADVSPMLYGEVNESVMTLLTPVTYALHIGHRTAFGLAGLQRIKLRVEVSDSGTGNSPAQFDWLVATPEGDFPLRVEKDTTGGLGRSGEVVVVPPSKWPAGSMDGIESLWLTLRPRREPDAAAAAGHWRPPRLAAIDIYAVAATGPQAIAAACHDGMPLDISKDFFPLGERPRFGAVMQLLSPSFGEPGAKIEIQFRLTNPDGAAATPIPPVSRAGRPSIVWEIATTNGFRTVAANDGTGSLTQDGLVTFTVPNDVAAISIAGKTGPWLRARLASGDYGGTTPVDGTAVPVAFAPAVRSLTVRSTVERGPLQADLLVSQGALTSRRIDPRGLSSADLFPSPDVDDPTLYVGLDTTTAPGELAKGSVLDWYVKPAPPTPPLAISELPPKPTGPRWQIRSADGWRDVAVQDSTADMARPGIVKLILPDAPGEWPGNILDPRKLVWLRIVWPAQHAPGLEPRLPIRLAINSVEVRHSQRLSNEIVGSSNGRPGQVFRALRTPIVEGVLLRVRESDDNWIEWNEVGKLASSHGDERDFTLDRSTGELHFGDGRFGRIPPAGANNIRLNEYMTGGGIAGNQPTSATVQLRGAVPSVDSVIMLDAAVGGLDAEDAPRVREHASAWLRHRSRAVCADDFADLAVRASPAVARAFCVAGRDLSVPSSAELRELEVRPDVVTTIVIPQSADPAPQPSLDLLSTVKTYLDERRSPVARLVIVGPTYTYVSVRLQVRPRSDWSPDAVASECTRRILGFLHPLTGASDGRGWTLGERPHRSDLYGLLDTIDGVDFVRAMSISIDLPPGMPIIIAAGTIEVQPVSGT